MNTNDKLTLLLNHGYSESQANRLLSGNRDLQRAQDEEAVLSALPGKSASGAKTLKGSEDAKQKQRNEPTQHPSGIPVNRSGDSLDVVAQQAIENVNRSKREREEAVLRAGALDGERLAYLRAISEATAYTRVTADLEATWIEGVIHNIGTLGLEPTVNGSPIELPPPVDNSHLLESLDRALGE